MHCLSIAGLNARLDALARALQARDICRDTVENNGTRADATVVFTTHYHADDGQYLAVCGSAPQFGAWRPKSALVAEQYTADWWLASSTLPIGKEFEWKWIVSNVDDDEVRWESAANRKAIVPKYSVRHLSLWNQPAMTTDLCTLPLLDRGNDVIAIRKRWWAKGIARAHEGKESWEHTL